MEIIPMVDLKTQYFRIQAEINTAIQKVLESTGFINGDEVRSFTRKLSDYLSCKHVIPCANGTDAIQIALMSLGLKPGDEVITSPFTFVATVEVIALLGLKPVFVDINADDFNIDIHQLADKISPTTRAIVPVHLFGQSCNMEALMKIAGQYKLGVVEDNAQAIGAKITYSDGTVKNAGTIGDIGTTSFFPSKNLGGYGDGGAIITDDSELAIKMHAICNHGSKIRYYHDIVGVNSRLDTLQAAILEVKLAYLDDYIRGRQAAAARYDTLLSEIPGITTPFQSPYSTHVYHQYTLKVDRNREGLQKFLNQNGISSAIYYPVPLHLQKAYQYYGYKPGDFPVTEKVSELVLSLPIYPEIGNDTQEYIADKIKKFMLTN